MSAFRIFVAVYTQTYPTEAPALIKYSDLIQDLASRGHNCEYCDENFRVIRQGQPDAYPWSTIYWELWLRSQVSMKASQSTSHTSLPKAVKSPAIPKSYCNRFQRGEECSGCDYKHVCFNCEHNHGGLQCNVYPPTRTNPAPSHSKSHSSNANKS